MAAFLIHNGCGDDSFTDFCAGVVGLGRDWYDRALADPDNLAGHPAVQGVAAGTVNTSVLLTTGFQFAPLHAYEQLSEGDDGAYYQALDAAQREVGARRRHPAPARLLRCHGGWNGSRRCSRSSRFSSTSSTRASPALPIARPDPGVPTGKTQPTGCERGGFGTEETAGPARVVRVPTEPRGTT